MSAFKNDSAAKILDILFVCLLFGLFCLEESPGIDTECWSSSPACLHSSTHGCCNLANTTLVPQKTQQMLQDSWWICLIFLGQLSDGGGWKMHLYMQNMSGATPQPFRVSLPPTGTVWWFYGAELTHGESIQDNAEITQKTKYWTREGWQRCWACPFPHLGISSELREGGGACVNGVLCYLAMLFLLMGIKSSLWVSLCFSSCSNVAGGIRLYWCAAFLLLGLILFAYLLQSGAWKIVT